MPTKQSELYTIDGHKNIIISNTSNSTITINGNDSEELKDALKSLHRSSQNLIANIRNQIGGSLHFERQTILDDIIQAVADYPMTIIHGHAGIGKSGITKSFVEKALIDSAQVFAFKGDELIGNSLDEILSKKVGFTVDTEGSLKNGLLSQKTIVWVDSLEKLLENNQKDAFIDLLKLISKNADVRLVVTIRTYALAQLRFSFMEHQLTKIKTIEIPPLSNDEQKAVLQPFPFLQPLFDNPKIESLMRTLF